MNWQRGDAAPVRHQDPKRETLAERAVRLLGASPPDSTDHDACDRWLDRTLPLAEAALMQAAGHRSPEDGDEDAGTETLAALWLELNREQTAHRLRLFASVQSALAQLRGTTSAEAVFDRGVQLICDVCGFDRALIFRIHGSDLVIERVHFSGDPAGGKAFYERALADPPRLTHMLLETEMIRRRSAILVTDAAADPRTHKPLIAAGGSTSYVAAPIVPNGKVIGFVHADRRYSDRPVDELDRDVLHTFAEGFGYAVERAILLERLAAQRDQVRRMLRVTERIVDGFGDAELRIAELDAAGASTADHAVATVVGPQSRLHDLLTRRELEVLGLMAEGKTNAAIAEQLVVSPTTVKSHVQNILRKLRASNRAEAVSRYMSLREPGLR